MRRNASTRTACEKYNKWESAHRNTKIMPVQKQTDDPISKESGRAENFVKSCNNVRQHAVIIVEYNVCNRDLVNNNKFVCHPVKTEIHKISNKPLGGEVKSRGEDKNDVIDVEKRIIKDSCKFYPMLLEVCFNVCDCSTTIEYVECSRSELTFKDEPIPLSGLKSASKTMYRNEKAFHEIRKKTKKSIERRQLWPTTPEGHEHTGVCVLQNSTKMGGTGFFIFGSALGVRRHMAACHAILYPAKPP